MNKKKCLNCEWFVEETDSIGDYQHKEAVRKMKGFCLVQDLFTNVEPEDKGCKDWVKESE